MVQIEVQVSYESQTLMQRRSENKQAIYNHRLNLGTVCCLEELAGIMHHFLVKRRDEDDQ